MPSINLDCCFVFTIISSLRPQHFPIVSVGYGRLECGRTNFADITCGLHTKSKLEYCWSWPVGLQVIANEWCIVSKMVSKTNTLRPNSPVPNILVFIRFPAHASVHYEFPSGLLDLFWTLRLDSNCTPWFVSSRSQPTWSHSGWRYSTRKNSICSLSLMEKVSAPVLALLHSSQMNGFWSLVDRFERSLSA